MTKLALDGGQPVRTQGFPEWPIFGDLEEKLLLEVLHSGKWGGTGRVKLEELEQKFAAFHDAKCAVSTVNGTIAISVALMAAGVQPGDEVIMPPYTFIATATSALLFGAIPVFVDVEEDTLLLDPEKIEAAITPKTKAIVAVHIAGAPANMTRIKEIAEKRQLKVIEDGAQAVGAQWDGQGIGGIGDLGTFSFQSSKNINAGEGGMILSNDKEMSEYAWSLANVGRVRDGAWYQHDNIGWNLRMTEFQAAILLGQMSRLEEQLQKREKNAQYLTDLLNEIDGIQTMRRDARITRHAHHLFMFRIDPEVTKQAEKQAVIERINAEGIPVAAGYISLNLNKAVLKEVEKWTGHKRMDSCPISERMAEKEVYWLSQNVLLAEEKDMEDIAQAVKKVVQSYA